jgi:hypothetical protein
MPEPPRINRTTALVFIAVALIAGAVIGGFIEKGKGVAPPCGPPVKVWAPVPGGPNPPIIITGGSVEGRVAIPSGQNSGWTPTASPPTLKTVSSYDASVLSLNGVALTPGGTLGQYSATGLSNNWRVTLFFRDNNGNDAGNNAKTLTISAKTDSATPPPNKSFILLTGDGNGEFSPQGPIDGYDFWRYDLKPDSTGCMQVTSSGVQNRKCNHVIRVRVQGVSTWTAGNTTTPQANPTDFYCTAGACDIYVGP